MINITENIAWALDAAMEIMESEFSKIVRPRSWLREIGKPQTESDFLCIKFTFWLHGSPDTAKYITVRLRRFKESGWLPAEAEVSYKNRAVKELWDLDMDFKPHNKRFLTD